MKQLQSGIFSRPFPNRLAHMLIAAMAALIMVFAVGNRAEAQSSQYYSSSEVIDAGHRFFGATSGSLASAVEETFAKYGRPNGYILGEEAGGAFIGGLRYGEGQLFTKNAGDHKVFWQGPSIGWDYGADGNRTMVLVYNLPTIDDLYRRYLGVSGSAFLVGGLGVTALTRDGVHLVPIRTGVGARLGINVGYLKMRRAPTINPF